MKSGSESRERHGFETHLHLPMDFAWSREKMLMMSSWRKSGAESAMATGIFVLMEIFQRHR